MTEPVEPAVEPTPEEVAVTEYKQFFASGPPDMVAQEKRRWKFKNDIQLLVENSGLPNLLLVGELEKVKHQLIIGGNRFDRVAAVIKRAADEQVPNHVDEQ